MPEVSQYFWTWLKGSDGIRQVGTYGTQGTASNVNTPGARVAAVSWTYNGQLYLFGGIGYDATSGSADLNDLWRYDPTTNQWTWLTGSTSYYAPASYGTQGVASATNTPSAKHGATSWMYNDQLYLFGGQFFINVLNDLWRYNPASAQWVWLKGSDGVNQVGSYGTQGVASDTNTPGARSGAVSWTYGDQLYLFGGGGFNDLWRYNPTTNQWTWIKGSNTMSQSGSYGTPGIASDANTPGGRSGSVSWVYNNQLYLFGGVGYDAFGSQGILNDLWRYNPTTNQWTWVKGSNTKDQVGSYGIQGVSTDLNLPGARFSANSWVYNDLLYLFGGRGFALSITSGGLNDLWVYNTATNQWTWVNGSSDTNQNGSYGVQGVASDSNMPSAREGPVSWVDTKVYLFGGNKWTNDTLNDLWALSVIGTPIFLSDVKATPAITVPCQPFTISWRIAPSASSPNHRATITSSFFSWTSDYTSDFASVPAVGPMTPGTYPITVNVARAASPTFSDQKIINLIVAPFILSDLRVIPATAAPNQTTAVFWNVYTNLLPPNYYATATINGSDIAGVFSDQAMGFLSFPAPTIIGSYPIDVTVRSIYVSDCLDNHQQVTLTVAEIAPVDQLAPYLPYILTIFLFLYLWILVTFLLNLMVAMVDLEHEF